MWASQDSGCGKLLLTVTEAAAARGSGRSLLYALVMRGQIRSVKIGRARRIPAAELEDFIERLREESDNGLDCARRELSEDLR